MSGNRKLSAKYYLTIAVVFAIIGGTLFVFYIFLLLFGMDQRGIFGFLVPTGLLCFVGGIVGIKRMIYIAQNGPNDEIWPIFDLGSKVWHKRLLFWTIALLIIPVFMHIYLIPLTAILWIISWLVGSEFNNYKEMIEKVSYIIVFAMAAFTTLALWKSYKKDL